MRTADMSTTNKPERSLVSLFAGCGGSSLGYKQAGFDIRLAVEWDTKAADVYRRNFPETSIFGGDIADLTAEEALEITGLQPGELDVLDGSPPCQGFSTAGARNFTDSRNRLFEQYVRMIDVFRPKILIMENVSGLRKGKMKLMFAEMTIALKQAGYRVSCRELNAWWYGVPQDRRRLIWVGVRDDLDMEPGHPAPTVKRPVSVQEALYHVDGIEESYGGIKVGWRSPKKPCGTMPAIRPRRIKLRNPDFENKWKDGDGVGPTFKSSQPPLLVNYGKSQVFRDMDGISPTLVANEPRRITCSFTFPCNADRDGKPMDQPVGTMAAIRPPSVTDGKAVRYLTIEESKTLQGFPAWFELKENEYKFVGNSVCPPMAEAIGNHLLNLLVTV